MPITKEGLQELTKQGLEARKNQEMLRVAKRRKTIEAWKNHQKKLAKRIISSIEAKAEKAALRGGTWAKIMDLQKEHLDFSSATTDSYEDNLKGAAKEVFEYCLEKELSPKVGRSSIPAKNGIDWQNDYFITINWGEEKG